MKKNILLILAFCGSQILIHAQQQSVIAAAGDHYEKSTCSISWTLGECITGFTSTSDCSVSQGFQLGNLVVEELPNSIPGPASFVLEVFPNPATDFITVRLDEFNAELVATIYGLTGQQFIKEKLTGLSATIDLSELKPGPYILKIANNDQGISETYKIVKF